MSETTHAEPPSTGALAEPDNRALAIADEVARLATTVRSYLEQADNPRLSEDDRKGCLMQAASAARRLNGMVCPIAELRCLTARSSLDADLPPEILKLGDKIWDAIVLGRPA